MQEHVKYTPKLMTSIAATPLGTVYKPNTPAIRSFLQELLVEQARYVEMLKFNLLLFVLISLHRVLKTS